MSTTPPKFNFRDTARWRSVDLRTTMKIAHICTHGVNFSGCCKWDIIEGMAKPSCYSSNAEKFVSMMDSAAQLIPSMKRKFDQELGAKIIALGTAWDEGLAQKTQ